MATKEEVLQLLKDSNFRIAPFWCEQIGLYVFVGDKGEVFVRREKMEEWKHMEELDSDTDLIKELEEAKNNA
jgi:hypothetical protein